MIKTMVTDLPLHDKALYSGEIIADQLCGFGILKFTSGALYEGYFTNNQYNGYGCLTTQDGTKYQGNFSNGYLCSQNKYYEFNTVDGSIYCVIQGDQFSYGQLEGIGSKSYYNNIRIFGEFISNQTCGISRVILDDGTIHDGLFASPKNYVGITQYSSNDVYVGNNVNNLKQGLGKYFYQSGEIYLGYWDNDTFEGIGVFVYENCDYYFGEWKNGVQNGIGVMIVNDEIESCGIWDSGEFVEPDEYRQSFQESFISMIQQFNEMFIDIVSYVKINDERFPDVIQMKPIVKNNSLSTFSGYLLKDQAFGQCIFDYSNGNQISAFLCCDDICDNSTIVKCSDKQYYGKFIINKFFTEDNQILSLDLQSGIINWEYVGQNQYLIPYGKGSLTFQNMLFQSTFKTIKECSGLSIVQYKTSGIIYKGELKDYQRFGYGRLAYPNGYHFSGQFIDNELIGLGKISFNNSFIIAQFEQGIIEGHFYYNDEISCFIGVQQDNWLQGQSQFVNNNNAKTIIWKDNVQVLQIKQQFVMEEVYKSMFENYQPIEQNVFRVIMDLDEKFTDNNIIPKQHIQTQSYQYDWHPIAEIVSLLKQDLIIENEITLLSSNLYKHVVEQAFELKFSFDQVFDPKHMVPYFKPDFVAQTIKLSQTLLQNEENIVYINHFQNEKNSYQTVQEMEINYVNVQQLTTLDVKPKIIVVGDLHGSMLDLLHIFKYFGYPSSQVRYVFMGDYVDRGPFGIEILVLLLRIKILAPSYLLLLRGNHEDTGVNKQNMFSFEMEILLKYPNNNNFIELFYNLFKNMPLMAFCNQTLSCAHAGVYTCSREQFEKLDRCILKIDRDNPQLYNVLWCDYDYSSSTRDRLTEQQLNNFLTLNELKYSVRSHQYISKGIEIAYHNKLFTIFSASQYSKGGVSCLMLLIGKDVVIARLPAIE